MGGGVASEFAGGSGTSDDAYQIATGEQLAYLAKSVNETPKSYDNTYFKLTDDIDLDNHPWTSIGTSNNVKIIFDGCGKTVRNLYINDKSLEHAGLFGLVSSTLRNITIENAQITAQKCIGALAGNNYTGSQENCHLKGVVKIEGNYDVAGIVGYSYGKVENCSVAGANGSYIRGIWKEDNLEGDNVGGIIGYPGEGNSVLTERIKGNFVKNMTISGTRKVGGIAGFLNYGLAMVNCYTENVNVRCEASKYNYTKERLSTGGLVGEIHPYKETIQAAVKNSYVRGTRVYGEDGNTGLIIGAIRDLQYKDNLVVEQTYFIGRCSAVTTSGDINNLGIPAAYVVNAGASAPVTYNSLQDAVNAVTKDGKVTWLEGRALTGELTLNETAFTLCLGGTWNVTDAEVLTVGGDTASVLLESESDSVKTLKWVADNGKSKLKVNYTIPAVMEPVKPTLPDTVADEVKEQIESNTPSIIFTDPEALNEEREEAAVVKASEAISGALSADVLTVNKTTGAVEIKAETAVEAAVKIEGLKEVTTQDILPLPVFTSDVSAPGKTAMVAFSIKGGDLKAENPADVKVLKILGAGKGALFDYKSEITSDIDGAFTIETKDGAIYKDKIVSDDTYLLVLFIKDGGKFDLDVNDGSVADPASIVKLAPAAPAATSHSGSGSSGCNAGGWAFALLALCIAPKVFRGKR